MHTKYIVRGLAAALLISGAAWSTTNTASAAGAIAQGKKNQPAPIFSPRSERCNVEATPADTLELIETLTSGTKDAGGIVTIPVYWHVVTTASGGGNISARIPEQSPNPTPGKRRRSLTMRTARPTRPATAMAMPSTSTTRPGSGWTTTSCSGWRSTSSNTQPSGRSRRRPPARRSSRPWHGREGGSTASASSPGRLSSSTR